MSLKNINIIYKFMAYFMLVSIVPLLIMGGVSFTTSASIVREQSEQYTQEIVNNQLDYLELEQSQIENLITAISGTEPIRDSVSDENATSTTFSRLSTEAQIGYALNNYINIDGLISIDIFATNGLYYSVGDTLVVENIRTTVQERIWQEALASDKQVFWVGIEDNINADSPHPKVVTAGTVFYQFNRDTVQQEPKALLLVNYSVDELYDHFSQVDLGADTYMIVVDTKGRLIYHPDRTRIGMVFDNNILSKMNDEDGTLSTRVENEDVSISYVRSSRSGWIIASFVPGSTFEATAFPIRNAMLYTLLATFSFVGVIAYLYNQDIVSPIRELTRRFKQLEEKPVTNESHMPERGTDEIGELIQGFNLLVDSLIVNRQVETEREQLILDLQVAMNFAQESSRLKSQFLATISHELRTPLNAIIGYSGIIVEGYGGEVDADARHMVERIYNASDHLHHLIDDLLDLSKIEAGYLNLNYEAFALRTCVEGIQQEMAILADQSKLQFHVNIEKDTPVEMVSDESRIKQILINLISNAIKFTEKGEITVTVQSITSDFIEFKVTDTGIGIPNEAINYIFEEFRQIDGSYQRTHGGTGLGLAIVYRIVTALQGTIQVESEVSKGSTFSVYLPVVSLHQPTDNSQNSQKEKIDGYST